MAERKKQIVVIVVITITILMVISLSIVVINIPMWSGWTGLNGKTAWDLADLLFVPLVLVLIAYIFNRRQKEYELRIAQEERKQEREIARERVEEASLQNYFDKMTELLLKENLRNSGEDSEVRSIARARTLTVLRNLDGFRKGNVVRFLYEAKLIDAEKTIIDLAGADLQRTYLLAVDLSKAYFGRVNLRNAFLLKANLREAYLEGANLEEVSLLEACLEGANLSGARLHRAHLKGSNLSGAKLDDAYLQNANLEKANLQRACLRGTYLTDTNLEGADLSGADLSTARLFKGNIILASPSLDVKIRGAKYNNNTQWPPRVDPKKVGAILVE
jgi:uncharacterized protein YjbI with pentapeptide repeats